MKICDRCEGRPITLPLMDNKDHIHYDLCSKCQEEFYQFMARKVTVAATESGMMGTIVEEEVVKGEKRGPGRPKKNGTN